MRHFALSSLAIAALVAALVASAASGGTRVQHGVTTAAGHCKVVGKGTRWTHYHGQSGTAYTIEGDRATACAVGLKWLVRLTNVTGVPKSASPPCPSLASATRRAGASSSGRQS